MVGPVTPTEIPESPATVETKSGLAGFLSTTIGKVVVGGVLVVVLAGILGAILFFYLLSQVPDELEVVVTPTTGSPSATATDAAPAPQQRPSPKVENTFTFRNVFRPTVKPAIPASETADASGTAGVNVPPDTLYLQDVKVVDGEEVAVLIWNGQTYEAGEGESLGDTPWKVLSIDGNTVVMLYGDSRVTLTVGQAVGK